MTVKTRLALFLTFLAALVAVATAVHLLRRNPPPPPPPPPPKPYTGNRWGALSTRALDLHSPIAMVQDQETGEILYERDADTVTPIASITKLMTAMVLLDSGLSLSAPVTVVQEDVDTLKNSLSHLPVGWMLTREDLLNLALMSSDNRAAAALARTFPGGTPAFVTAMNAKAMSLGMMHTHFVDPHGLHPDNTSTARDLLLMVDAAYTYPTIRRMTTMPDRTVVALNSGRARTFGNSDYLVAREGWSVGLSKTGFILESGFCLALQAKILGRPVVMIFLKSEGKHTRQGDAARVRTWLEESVTGHKGGGGSGPLEREHSRRIR